MAPCPALNLSFTGPQSVLFYASPAINILSHRWGRLEKQLWKQDHQMDRGDIQGIVTRMKWCSTVTVIATQPFPRDFHLFLRSTPVLISQWTMYSLAPSHFYDQLSTSAVTAAY